MKIVIKNQLNGTVDLCVGMQEYRLDSKEEILAPVSDGDYIYLDQVTRPNQCPADRAVSEVYKTMRQYKNGELDRLEALSQIGVTVAKYFADEKPIPYELTDKAGASDDQSPA